MAKKAQEQVKNTLTRSILIRATPDFIEIGRSSVSVLLSEQFIEIRSTLALTKLSKHFGSKENGDRVRDYYISVVAWQLGTFKSITEGDIFY